jgi:hypothetical protein
MTLEEQKALADKIGNETTDQIKAATTGLEAIAKKAAEETVKNAGILSEKTFEEYKAANDKAIDDLKVIAKKSEIEVDKIIKQGLTGAVKTAFDVMFEDFETKKAKIDTVIKDRAGSIELKNVINVGGISAGNSYSGIAIAASVSGTSNIRESVEGSDVFTQARTRPTLAEFANVTISNDRVVTYFEENNRTGSFQLTAEGGLKPFVGYGFTKYVQNWKKATGRAPFTEEFMLDFALLYTTIRALMIYDCRNDLDTVLMSDAIAAAAPYLNPSLALKVDNADFYGAIGAVICQIALANQQADFVAINPADAWIAKLLKGTTGYYVTPPYEIGGQVVAGGNTLRVIESPKVAVGNILVGDSSAYNIRMKPIPEVRIGYASDTHDFVRNQLTTIVELAYFNWLPSTRRPAFVYTSVATVLTAIEKP